MRTSLTKTLQKGTFTTIKINQIQFMTSIIGIALCNILILIFAFITKIGLYTVSPEEEWADNLKEFDTNLKAIENMDSVSEFNLGTGHLYE